MKADKKTKNAPKNTTQKSKDSERLSCSCFTSCTRRVAAKRYERHL